MSVSRWMNSCWLSSTSISVQSVELLFGEKTNCHCHITQTHTNSLNQTPTMEQSIFRSIGRMKHWPFVLRIKHAISCEWCYKCTDQVARVKEQKFAVKLWIRYSNTTVAVYTYSNRHIFLEQSIRNFETETTCNAIRKSVFHVCYINNVNLTH